MSDISPSLPTRMRQTQPVAEHESVRHRQAPDSPPHRPKHVRHEPSADRRTIMTPLTYFAVSPDGVAFETQDADERVRLLLRPHIIVLVPSVLLILVLLLAPFFLVPLFLSILELPFPIPAGYVIVGTAFWYVVAFGMALTSYLRWFYNIYIVTDKRIVDIDFIHLLYKEFTEARLEKIQDITFKSGGIFAAFFDYGDVYVVTAGESPNIEFLSVPHPAKVVDTISGLLEQPKGGDSL